MDFASGRDCGRRDRHPALPGRCVHPGRRDRYRGPFPLRPGGARVMDAAGKLITPGFINMHSHSDCSAAMYPNMESTLGQDITTEFAGHCGLGVAPVQDNWLYMFPEKRAFTKVMPEPPGGINPYNAYLVPTQRLQLRPGAGLDHLWPVPGSFAPGGAGSQSGRGGRAGPDPPASHGRRLSPGRH